MAEKDALRLLKKFLPYYRHLLAVKWHFLIGVFAGLVYAAASGAELPLMTKVVFPVLFNEDPEQSKWYVDWLVSKIGEVSRDDLLIYTCLWIPAVFLLRAAGIFPPRFQKASSPRWKSAPTIYRSLRPRVSRNGLRKFSSSA